VFFIDQPVDLVREFPVRKSRKQKKTFQNAVSAYAEKHGYSCDIEQSKLGVRNIVIGNPDSAKFLITAHYDTCAALPFPNLITPCNGVLFWGWQLLLTILICLPVGILGGILGAVSDNPQLGVAAAYLLIWLELVLMLFGPANRSNANDNSSGVVTVLETAAAMPQEYRNDVCFVLFDLEEGGLLGSAFYRKKHRKVSANQLVLNLDCVGEGDEIILFPTKMLKKSSQEIKRLEKHCISHACKSISVRTKGFAVYPSDQMNFPRGLGIAAFCRSKWAGLYLGKIHTKRDINLDEINVALIRDYLLRIVQDQAEERK